MKEFETLLEGIIKPGRYLGNEWNVTRKNFSDTEVRVALCFPDLYEVGMSHLGFRIIYGLLNSKDGVLCERAFTPWPDFSDRLLQKNLPLFSLESRTPLNEFDIVAFTLSYEMGYTNILEMLKLSNIPLKSKDRKLSHPLIIGGGPCTLNPEPLSDFFDLFVIGEGEEVAIELVDCFRRMKKDNIKDRVVILSELAKIEGVYVPSLKKNETSKINKRIVHNLDDAFYPEKYIVPYVSIIHDRVVIEIMRGCLHRCRFCQASAFYRPVRTRSREKVLELIKNTLKNTGYEEFSLMSLSSGDYPDITSLAQELSDMQMLKEKSIAFSFSSLRIEDVLSKLPSSIKKIKKTGLTLAPEAGTRRLRKIVSKDIDTKKLLDTIKIAKQEGWRRIKLYFMIGLPTETYEDIDGIINLLGDIVQATKKGAFDIAVTISQFIPKPHTPLQWEKTEGMKDFIEKQRYIKSKMHSGRVKLKFHNAERSMMEAIFSRGDKHLGRVLLTAFKNGARFDSWDEFFKFDIWMEAFKKEGIDPSSYTKRRDFKETLPWDHINTGIPKDSLIKEAEQTLILAANIDNI